MYLRAILKKFQRIHLKAGEQKAVELVLQAEDLMLLDTKMQWVVEPGDFDVMVGASSDDIRLGSTFKIKYTIQPHSLEK